MPRTLLVTILSLAALTQACYGQAPHRFMGGPVTLEDQGSFFIGGVFSTGSASTSSASRVAEQDERS